ncbi:MAG: ATP-binding protein [bacterium]
MKIEDRILKPEGRRLEFKENLSQGDRIERTVIAFSNDAGGEIYIGIKNDPEIEVKYLEPGLSFQMRFIKKNFLQQKSGVATDLVQGWD